MPGERLGEHAPHQRMLVGVVDLGAAEPPRDPRDRDTLRIARRPVLEREIASGRRPGIEMLMKPGVGRNDQGADLPVVTARFLALGPHQRVALAREHDDVGARPMRMRLLVGADRELGDVAGDRAARHVEADMAAAGAALLGGDQRQVDRVGNEIGLQQEADLLALGAVIVGFAGEAVDEIVPVIEHEIDVVVEVDDRGRIGNGDITHRFLARSVEVLVPAIERDGEDRARLPFEGDAGTGVVPHGGRTAAGQDQDHLFEQMMLRLELAARRDLADVAVVGGARGLVVDEHALAALARPRLQFGGAQVRHVLCADDVEPLAAHEAQIGRILFGLEFVRELLRDDRVLGHGCPPGGSLHRSGLPAAGDGEQCAWVEIGYAAVGIDRRRRADLTNRRDQDRSPGWR